MQLHNSITSVKYNVYGTFFFSKPDTKMQRINNAYQRARMAFFRRELSENTLKEFLHFKDGSNESLYEALQYTWFGTKQGGEEVITHYHATTKQNSK